ncbi:MAG: hypothetical protein WBQ38_11230 [Ignavibacteria bacterium]|nr:hypothetical protein [Ignavibacteria bacterium]
MSCNIKENDLENNEGKQVSLTHNSDSSSHSSNNENSKYTGLYKGIYFYPTGEAGGTDLENIFPILLINDTCSYLYFGNALIYDINIVDNVIEFPDDYYFNGTKEIYIDTSEVEIPFNEYNIKYDGKIYKISDLSDRDFFILNEAIEENNYFFKYFWRNFIEALRTDNVDWICDHIHFPFVDNYGEIYPVFSEKSSLSADNKAEFVKVYPKIFTNEVKLFLYNNLPRKRLGSDVYNINVHSANSFFRKFLFEKFANEWWIRDLPYLE